MNTDRDLLEMAAKAAGIKTTNDPDKILRNTTGFYPSMNIFAAPVWNPITDDGDALRLATYITAFGWQFSALDAVALESLQKKEDVTAAIRLAIVRAAAAIGGEMK